MTTQTTKVKNGTIEIPRALRPVWENADVYISGERDRISIQRLSSPPLSAMLDELNDAGKDIPKTDLDQALRAARRSKI